MRIITASFSCGAALAATLIAAPALALVIDLTPGQINNGDTNTASFTDGKITLTPFVGETQSTFNANAERLGIDGTGTNANAFNDPDVDPNNGNEEKLQFEFDATVGLSRIAYDFSRADGPGLDDGVIITGFLVDPQVSFSVDNPNLFGNYAAGRLRLNIPSGLFNGNDVDINFGVPSASAGQTLLLSVTDTTQAGGATGHHRHQLRRRRADPGRRGRHQRRHDRGLQHHPRQLLQHGRYPDAGRPDRGREGLDR